MQNLARTPLSTLEPSYHTDGPHLFIGSPGLGVGHVQVAARRDGQRSLHGLVQRQGLIGCGRRFYLRTCMKLGFS